MRNLGSSSLSQWKAVCFDCLIESSHFGDMDQNSYFKIKNMAKSFTKRLLDVICVIGKKNKGKESKNYVQLFYIYNLNIKDTRPSRVMKKLN